MRNLKDMETNRLKMLFGLILLLALCGLLATIALGHVYENSSYGLLPLIATLSTLAGAFSNWAFGHDSHGNGNGNGDSVNGKGNGNVNGKEDDEGGSNEAQP